MYDDVEDALQDLRRMVALHGPFHPYVKRFVDENWHLDGFPGWSLWYRFLGLFG